MTIPDWLLKMGSLAGLFTFCFTIWDRLLKGRPSVWIRKTGYRTREIHCSNISIDDLIILNIRCIPGFAAAAEGDSYENIARATLQLPFAAVLKAGDDRDFPLVFLKGGLLDDECRESAPFVLLISGRKVRSTWLPQIPVFIVTSAKAMRLLETAK
jgi:hypothetical protein